MPQDIIFRIQIVDLSIDGLWLEPYWYFFEPCVLFYFFMLLSKAQSESTNFLHHPV